MHLGSRVAGKFTGVNYLPLPDFLGLQKFYLWIINQTYDLWLRSFYDFVDKNYNYGCQRL